jgi:hypothetical protein
MRLLTSSNFDGLVSTILLKEAKMIDSWMFINNKNIYHGAPSTIQKVTLNDVIVNLDYHDGCAAYFNNHSINTEKKSRIIARDDVSSSNVVYDYYVEKYKKLKKYSEVVKVTNKVAEGNLTSEEIMDQDGWLLLALLLDPITGLGRFREFNKGYFELTELLVNHGVNMSIDGLLQLPDIKERVEFYKEHRDLYITNCQNNAKIYGNVVVIDLREEKILYVGNRFLVYDLWKDKSVFVILTKSKLKDVIYVYCGNSILNKEKHINIGGILKKYGGSGNTGYGTCSVSGVNKDEIISELVLDILDGA